ncbi:MAG: hypothetical protein GY801_34110 [bacterium]|nr:hypothetical protein [bacterium]
MIEENRIWPVEEMLAYEEFTDRVELLRELEGWVKNIQRMTAPSTALIAPRRMGKTVLLDRLVNTVFFKPEYRVAPFYFKMKREETTLREFLLEYATTFFRQYLAYCLQDPELFKKSEIELRELLDYPAPERPLEMAQESIRTFLRRYERNSYEDARNHWDAFIRVPELLGSRSGIRVAVIIDEFQDMKFYIHHVSRQRLDDIMASPDWIPGIGGINLTATYDRQAQSRKAPMLVSGSAVTMVFRTVMGGPLGGRFGFKYLRPFSIPDGATLLQQVLPLYAPGLSISTEHAVYASTQVGGHPYYLYCLAVSEYEGKRFGDAASIDRVIRYEIEQGKIYGFWQTHFQDNRQYINADNDIELGKKIIYYCTRYNDRPVDIKAIARTLNVSKYEVEAKIENLYQADLMYRSAAKYYTFNDICLMRYIKFVYEQDLEGIEEIDLSQQNLFNTLKGKFLELVVQVTMMKMNHEVLDGRWFGITGEIEAPLFQHVKANTVQASATPQYQIDVYGQVLGEPRLWLCECKYTKTAMGMKQVEKLERAAEVVTQDAEEVGRSIPDLQFWLVSTGGFTKEVKTYVDTRNDMYASDHDGINAIFHAYGGNYRIPIFQHT